MNEDEIFQYKMGVIDGKWTALDIFYQGKLLNFQTGKKMSGELKGWYKFGFIDGFHYFNELILDDKLNFEQIDNKKIQEELFYKRVRNEIKNQKNKRLKVKSK